MEQVEYALFDQDAPAAVWAGVSRVYVLAFAAPPYDESPDELRQVEQWGPAMLATPGGRLVVALRNAQVLGFVISERLDHDQSWQQLLRTAGGSLGADIAAAPSAAVIVQELAVDGQQRGQGIARALVSRLLADRPEAHAVLSVYQQAAQVRTMYQRWGFHELGATVADDGADTLHLMHQPLPWTLRQNP